MGLLDAALPSVSSALLQQPMQTPGLQLGSGMFDLNGSMMADPSIPPMPFGSGMFGMNQSPIPAAQQPTTMQPDVKGLLGLGKSMTDANKPKPPSTPPLPYLRGGPVNFMPSSAITMPYTTGASGLQSLMQQMLQQSQSNPLRI